ncbi:DNA primase [bacterium]|nr:DNA primase [bacterium]
MHYNISDADLDNIRSRVDIVELIESCIPLKRSGANYKACCPFHNEKTPSFVVNQQKQIYHCFGCHKGGDVFGFIMEWEQLPFPEAVARLADRCGYTLTEKTGDYTKNSVKKNEKERLYDCLKTASELFNNYMFNDPKAEKARIYLLNRGLTIDTIKKWQIGFVPQNSGVWVNVLKKKGFSPQDLIKCGLMKKYEKTGRLASRFFNRIMFPIHDEQNRVVAFGARVMDDSLPKYVNSPETALYQKSKVLFGFNNSKTAIRSKKSMLVVEGYFDVIQLNQAGIETSAAPCGTSLTEQQLNIIKRYADVLYLAFDSDQAGVSAVFKKLDVIMEQGINARVVVLPKGEDPDSFIRKYGKENFEKKLDQGEPILDFRLKILVEQYGINDEFSRVKIAESMIETISKIKNDLLAESWLKKIGGKLNFSFEVLKNKYRQNKRKAKSNQNRKILDKDNNDFQADIMPPWEREIFIILLNSGGKLIDYGKKTLKKDFFSNIILRQLWENISSLTDDNYSKVYEHLINVYRDNKKVVSLLTEYVSQNVSYDHPESVFDDSLKRLKRDYLDKSIEKCMASLAGAEEEEVPFILKQLQEFKQEKTKLGVF